MSPRTDDEPAFAEDPLWFRDAVIYEVHVKTFSDSSGDGVGDFAGLVDKLDYLQDLGVTAIWLLPFYPSPLRDDGYDIADYMSVHPAYGTLRDFRGFLREAHARGLRVITELVINHTSDQHPWFQRARRAPRGSRHRDFYMWSDDPERYRGTRVIFQDFETSNWAWEPVAGQYYWHRFYSHQPDLNFDSPDVQRELLKVVDFWMDMGVDGMRLDAVPYLYAREGTNCENLPETHDYLKKLRAHVDAKHPGRMLLAEANQWPEDASAYFGDGDECHMNFHFPLMPRMFMALQLENNYPILDILAQTPSIPESCQWAVFLRNHDELTLEMVTDEDRDYMYRVYAADPRARINVGIRRRLAPLVLGRQKIELLNGLLFSLPGTPVIYYGDEIGMGDNIYLGDRDSVRTPMQWTGDRNAGFSRANPQKLYLPPIIDPEYHYESLNVEAQQSNPSSLLWWMKRIIALRNQLPVFGRGDVEMLDPENPKVLAFVRTLGEDRVLVVANLSRYPQFTELDLGRWAGMVPVELFGLTEFPPIGELPYLLSLGAHSFYWLQLRRPEHELEAAGVPVLETTTSWENLVTGRARRSLERILPGYVRERRWFRGKARKLKSATIADDLPITIADGVAHIALVRVEYGSGPPEIYVLPLAFSTGERAAWLEEHHPHAVVARVRVRPGKSQRGEPEVGILHDALPIDTFADALLNLLGRRNGVAGRQGRIGTEGSRSLRAICKDEGVDLSPRAVGAEQTNTSITYGDQLILKVFRLLEEGENPDLEVCRHLASRVGFAHTPPVLGSLSYGGPLLASASLGIVHGFVPNQGDAWQLTLDMLGLYFEGALARTREMPEPELPLGHLLYLARREVPESEVHAIGAYLPLVRLLAERTAELHAGLARSVEDPAFRPEPFTELHQRSLYQSARTRLGQTFRLLRGRGRIDQLPEGVREEARSLLGRQGEVDALFRALVPGRIRTERIRCHGDYHLGQVLYTGKDFVIIDFEGEPARPIGERRIKRTPLVDVAGMLRSFHYATVAALRHGTVRPDDVPVLDPWGELWHRWVASSFLGAYLEAAGGASFLPENDAELRRLLDFCMLDKCVYELGYELNNRPDWLPIPIRGLIELLDQQD